MALFKRLSSSIIKRLPGGVELLQRRAAKKVLFASGLQSYFRPLYGANKEPDQVYLMAFNRIFLLLQHFYQTGMRGDVLEFGVFRGYTARLLADCLKRFEFNTARLHLFDSFAGLPKCSVEDQKSHEVMSGAWGEGILGVPPGIEKLICRTLQRELGEDRVAVIKGFFNETLESHIRQARIKKALLVHLDCDLYSSSKYVLDILVKYDLLQQGSIIICDDWMCSFGNPHVGQRKAVQDFLAENPNWVFENYFNYGMGAHVFVAHNVRSNSPPITYENKSSCSHTIKCSP